MAFNPSLPYNIESGPLGFVAFQQSGTLYSPYPPYPTVTMPTGYVDSSSAAKAGTTTNDNAPAGFVGETALATVPSGSAVGLTTTVPANITSFSLTAGDWDVKLAGDFTLTAATVTQVQLSLSTVSATLGSQTGGSGINPEALITEQYGFTLLTGTETVGGPYCRVSLAATTTIYAVCAVTFSAGSVAAYGTLYARRSR